MPDSLSSPPSRRQALIARGEQLVLVILAAIVLAGVAYRAATYLRLGAEPMAVVPPADGPTYRVNVNAADWATLALVPGLGEVLSKRIVEVREARAARVRLARRPQGGQGHWREDAGQTAALSGVG